MDVLTLKSAVRERDGMRCVKCGLTNGEHLARHGKSLHVHRLAPGSAYSVDGCVTLCYRCHGPEPKSPPGTAKFLVVRIPDDVHQAMIEVAVESERTLAREVKLALVAWLRQHGEWPAEGEAPEPKKGRPKKGGA